MRGDGWGVLDGSARLCVNWQHCTQVLKVGQEEPVIPLRPRLTPLFNSLPVGVHVFMCKVTPLLQQQE